MERDRVTSKSWAPREKLACAFCKRKHHCSHFDGCAKGPNYGIRFLDMLSNPNPRTRYCSRRIPKRICYSPPSNSSWYYDSWEIEKDLWISTADSACSHCGERLIINDDGGKPRCPICVDLCNICGYCVLPMYTRHGSNTSRDTEGFGDLFLVRRGKNHDKLEIRDGKLSALGREHTIYSIIEERIDYALLLQKAKFYSEPRRGGLPPEWPMTKEIYAWFQKKAEEQTRNA